MKSIDLSKLKGNCLLKKSKSNNEVKEFRKLINGGEETVIDKLQLKVTILKKTHFFNITHFNELSNLPIKDESIHIIVQQQINVFSLIYEITKHENIEIAFVTTYSINETAIAGFLDLLDTKKIHKLYIVVARGMKQLQNARYQQLVQAINFRKGKLSVAFIDNHTKIVAIKTTQNFYVIEGSGNFSSNAKIEQYTFYNSEDLYQFHKAWISNYCFIKQNVKRHEILQ